MSSECTLILIALVAVSLGCADFERGEPLADASVAREAAIVDTSGADAVGSSFARDVHAVVLNGCAGCHSAGGTAASTGLVYVRDVELDHLTSLRFVNLEQPASSRLLAKAAGTGHGGGVVLAPGSSEYEVVFTWIAEGALP